VDRGGKHINNQSEITDFYDRRIGNPEDLNVRLAGSTRPAHHHTGIVRINEPVPDKDADALIWLYRSEEALSDLLWYVIQGLSQRRPQQMLDLGCGEGGTIVRFYELAQDSFLEMVGITLSKKQQEIATRSCPQGRFLVGDMLSENALQGRNFDVAYAIEATEYLGPTKLETFMECARSWLAPQGLLVVVAGSRSPTLALDHPIVRSFNSHYRTKLTSTEDYRQSAVNSGFRPVAEMDLGPVTLPYWQARRDRTVLCNSEDAAIERIIVTGLEGGMFEYRLYAWYHSQ
jgi:SAM-dependent methyltransferase